MCRIASFCPVSDAVRFLRHHCCPSTGSPPQCLWFVPMGLRVPFARGKVLGSESAESLQSLHFKNYIHLLNCLKKTFLILAGQMQVVSDVVQDEFIGILEDLLSLLTRIANQGMMRKFGRIPTLDLLTVLKKQKIHLKLLYLITTSS